MDFHRITSPADPLYRPALEIYGQSFPLHEQRLPASQEQILAHPAYHFTCLTEGEQLIGILLYWETADFSYVEHFAVDPALRGQNYGGRALKELCAAGRPVLLEIDPLTTEIAVRRQKFYQRLGFQANPYGHVHPPYRAGFQGHELIVMSYPQAISEGLYQTFAAYLKDVVMA